MSSGLVSIVLPCYQAERYLRGALASLLAQSYEDLEIVAVDDGSTDATPEILRAAASEDGRVRVVAHDTNEGVIRALNRGVSEARGAFLARMDADDVAAPERIARQVELLRARPDVSVVGTGVRLVDPDGRVVGERPVRCTEPVAARYMAFFGPPVAHPTLLARGDALRRYGYRSEDECLHVEDYDLFVRMLEGGEGISNVDAPLLDYRVSPASVSSANEPLQIRNFVALARRYLEASLGEVPPPGEHRALVNRLDPDVTVSQLVRGVGRLTSIRQAFVRHADPGPRARREIHAITEQQRLDVLAQAALKGTLAQRAAALTLALLHSPKWLSRPTLRYAAGKLRGPVR